MKRQYTSPTPYKKQVGAGDPTRKDKLCRSHGTGIIPRIKTTKNQTWLTLALGLSHAEVANRIRAQVPPSKNVVAIVPSARPAEARHPNDKATRKVAKQMPASEVLLRKTDLAVIWRPSSPSPSLSPRLRSLRSERISPLRHPFAYCGR